MEEIRKWKNRNGKGGSHERKQKNRRMYSKPVKNKRVTKVEETISSLAKSHQEKTASTTIELSREGKRTQCTLRSLLGL